MERQDQGERQERQELSTRVDNLARHVVDAGLMVHQAVGPGLLESAYEACLAHEHHERGSAVARQVALPVEYKNVRLEATYRLDMIAGGAVIIEGGAVDTLTRLHEAQLLTYLRSSRLKLGFLMNFSTLLFNQGLKRLTG